MHLGYTLTEAESLLEGHRGLEVPRSSSTRRCAHSAEGSGTRS